MVETQMNDVFEGFPLKMVAGLRLMGSEE